MSVCLENGSEGCKKLESGEALVGQCDMVRAWLEEVTPEMGNKEKLYVSEEELRDIGEWV